MTYPRIEVIVNSTVQFTNYEVNIKGLFFDPEVKAINSFSLPKKKILGFFLVATLVFVLTLTGMAQEEEDSQTPSEMAKIGYRNVGSVMSGVSGAEVDKKQLKAQALNNLFNELANHLDDKGVPEHVVEKFRNRFQSATGLYEEGIINKNQLSSETSTLVQNLGRRDEEGEISSSVLEKAGMGEKDIKQLAGNGKGKGKSGSAEMVKSLARETEEEQEQNRERKEKEVEKKDREREDQKGDRGKGKEKGNGGKGQDDEEDESESRAEQAEDKGNGANKEKNDRRDEDEEEEKDNQGRGNSGSKDKDKNKGGNSGNGKGNDKGKGKGKGR